MRKNKCVNCSEHKNCSETSYSLIFFVIGLVATIAIRAVTALMYANPAYGQAAWYIGVSGFLIFFMYKYRVEKARHRLIESKALVSKVSGDGNLEKDDRELIGSILCALSSKKDRINYLFIFVSSAAALIIAI